MITIYDKKKEQSLNIFKYLKIDQFKKRLNLSTEILEKIEFLKPIEQSLTICINYTAKKLF